MWWLVVLSCLQVSSVFARSEVRVKCLRYSNSCYACSDGLNRKTSISTLKASSKNDLVSSLACAQSSLRSKAGCVAVSDFCAICPDGTFLLTSANKKIRTDLYECMTKPRAFQSFKGR